ncbi:hypothetical protein N0V87_007923 [Didymella glomerata]|uniref:Uncharacterized protein n=1 Tax=Didymella glomerata TaxID=749621 RepID=A0A9W8WV25_9PLEO|nr:hypothetical protein N0V87_007923 [Didymella glomerata]
MSTSQTTADVTAAGLSQVDQNINNTEEDRSHEARGHKANLSNPNTSQASKEKSAKILKELGEDGVSYGKQGKGE